MLANINPGVCDTIIEISDTRSFAPAINPRINLHNHCIKSRPIFATQYGNEFLRSFLGTFQNDFLHPKVAEQKREKFLIDYSPKNLLSNSMEEFRGVPWSN